MAASPRARPSAPRRARRVYGRTTGVGANRHVEVDGDLREHRRGCCAATRAGSATRSPPRSCAARSSCASPRWPPGNGGHRPEVADALIGVLRADALPELRDLGGLGTGDLTVLAQLGLALADSGRLEIEPATRCR